MFRSEWKRACTHSRTAEDLIKCPGELFLLEPPFEIMTVDEFEFFLGRCDILRISERPGLDDHVYRSVYADDLSFFAEQVGYSAC